MPVVLMDPKKSEDVAALLAILHQAAFLPEDGNRMSGGDIELGIEEMADAIAFVNSTTHHPIAGGDW